MTERLNAIQANYTPDLRLELFEVSLDSDACEAEVSTTSSSARDAILAVQNEFPTWRIKVSLYPEENEELDGKWRGLVNFSSIQLQKGPDFAAEWGTQAVMGSPVRIIKRSSNGWLLIQTFDGYLGYTPSGSIHAMSKEEYVGWLESKRLVTLDNYGFIYSKPSFESGTISDLTIGCVLVWKDSEVQNGFYHVETPDGRPGWLPTSNGMEWRAWLDSRELTADNLISTARRFLGSPYVWGGTTSKGVDCSGLVSLSFRVNGYTILRDVSQIRREGIEVDITKGYGNIQPGDLLIFGKKQANGSTSWHHVAIYIGEGRFIHSATSVHESSLDPSSPIYDQSNASKLIKVVRMIGAPSTEHFRSLRENQFLNAD